MGAQNGPSCASACAACCFTLLTPALGTLPWHHLAGPRKLNVPSEVRASMPPPHGTEGEMEA